MKPVLVLLFFLSLVGNSFSQSDSVAFPANARMEDGIFLSFQDFRHNRRIAPQDIDSKEDKSQQEFITKALYQQKIAIVKDGASQQIETKNIWGYFQNNTFYINYQGDFYRVPVFGSICYLVANVTVVNPGIYDPRFGYMGGGTSKELRQFTMDIYEGVPTEWRQEKVEGLLARDSALFTEFKQLSRRKQKDEVYRYIRKYNDLHPIYFQK